MTQRLYVWLVINTNGHTVSVCDDEASANAITARASQRPDPGLADWKVERWAIRHVPSEVTYCWRSGECVLPGGHDEPCSWGTDLEDEDD